MKSTITFVTGTDTGVGKTIFAAQLTREMAGRGVRVVALKPVSSGNRSDARSLRRAGGDVLSLDEINPWHFRAPIAPLLAARRERKRVTLGEVTAYIRRIAAGFDQVVVEGAGGLLSPLGEDFDSRDLILSLRAEAIIVSPNRLGAVNQVRLVLAALPQWHASRVKIVLMQPPRATIPSRTNPRLLAEFVDRRRVASMPWISQAR